MVVPNCAESGTPAPAVKIDEPFDLLAHMPACHLSEAAIMAESAAEGKGNCASCASIQIFVVTIGKLTQDSL